MLRFPRCQAATGSPSALDDNARTMSNPEHLTKEPAPREHDLRSVILPFVVGFVLFVSLECLVFRPALYGRIVAPRSYAGYFEMLVAGEKRLATQDPKPRMTIVGDSRIAEGFWEARAEEQVGGSWRFVNAAIPGSTPRVWFYLLRAIDPGRDRNRLVVIPLRDYPDFDIPEHLSNRMLDVRTAILHLGPLDLPRLLASFDGWGSRFRVLRAVLLKGEVLKEDLQDLLDDPLRRWNRIEQSARTWARSRHVYPGHKGSLEGLRYDPSSETFVFPTSVSEERRSRLVRSLSRPTQRGRMRRYRQLWLTAIVDYYRNSPTRVVFLRLPRGPIVASYRKEPSDPGVVDELARRPNVEELPEDLFDDLEKPRYFFDELHVNNLGRERFTTILIDALLGSNDLNSAARSADGDAEGGQ